MRRDFQGKWVLITGAASGIGRATAFAFAEEGASLVLTDIDEKGLARTALLCRTLGATVDEQRVDVSNARAMEALAERVHARIPCVDVVVNNAGVGVAGSFIGTSLETWDWALSVNLKGVVHGCHYFVPKIIERGCGGHVVNVASLAGLVASRRMSVYSATKFAVVGMSEALEQELAPLGISVTTICPGVIDTPITRNARLTGDLTHREGVRESMIAAYHKRSYGPRRVALAIVSAVRGRKRLVPVAPESWLLYYMKRVTPRLATALASVGQVDSKDSSSVAH
jgi:NAD(P)-dependent dehydrogenase (short-subunit alcohol dehydrogenase family)